MSPAHIRRILESRANLKAAFTVFGSAYLYFVGFFMGSVGSAVYADANATASVGGRVLALIAAPFMVLPAGLGLSYVFTELPHGAIGTGLAVVFLCAAFVALRALGLRGWWVGLFPLVAYAIGFAVEYVLTARFGVQTPPMSL